jgi:hypothetical protein
MNQNDSLTDILIYYPKYWITAGIVAKIWAWRGGIRVGFPAGAVTFASPRPNQVWGLLCVFSNGHWRLFPRG